MHPSEIEIDPPSFAVADASRNPPLDLLRRLNSLSASARVQAHACAVPALATLLMQGLVC